MDQATTTTTTTTTVWVVSLDTDSDVATWVFSDPDLAEAFVDQWVADREIEGDWSDPGAQWLSEFGDVALDIDEAQMTSR